MSGLSITPITKDNCNASTDDPKLALLTDLATAIDTINSIIAAAQADSARLTTLSGITAQQATDLAAVSTFIGTLLAAASAGVALTTLGAPLNAVAAKSAAYTVVAADRGKLIDYTSGSYTLSLDAAATLGPGFAFAVRNSGSGTITIDANASEQIDGATTVAIAAGESCLVVCNGTAWKTVGKTATPLITSFAESSEIAITGNAWHTFSHGLAATPKLFEAVLLCKTTDMGYAAGDEVPLGATGDTSSSGGGSSYKNATSVGIYMSSAIFINNKSTGSPATPTFANWKIVLRAWR